MNDPELDALLAAIQACGETLHRISAQLAAIDAALYRLRTQPAPRPTA